MRARSSGKRCSKRWIDADARSIHARLSVPSRIVHLPLSWDDPATQLAIQKYMQSVRPDAPWCPSNIEFIRRMNGLDSIDDVQRIVFEASYLVLGLGDVYLGAPVATPLDPRHRLVTTKYNPARTWTPENAVGIGGAYLCVYGMEGPGGYQFVGRTVQMWNTHRTTQDFEPGHPWLLRFFDQIRFYPVGARNCCELREDFPYGQVPAARWSLRSSVWRVQCFSDTRTPTSSKRSQQAAFDAERERWAAAGQADYVCGCCAIGRRAAVGGRRTGRLHGRAVAGYGKHLEAAGANLDSGCKQATETRDHRSDEDGNSW